MKKLLIACTCIALTIASLSGCGGRTSSTKNTKDTEASTTTLKVPEDWTLHQGTGYTIFVPSTWTSTAIDGAELAFYYEPTSNDKFAENFNIMLQDLSAYNMDLEAYKDLSLSQYESIGYTVASIEKGSIDNVDVYTLITTVDATVADGSTVPCKCLQVFAVKDKVAYVLSFVGDETGYTTLEEEILTMFYSVDFK